MRSTGVADEAACMVYLAISKLQVSIFGLACRDDEGLRGKLKWEWERRGGRKDRGGEREEKNKNQRTVLKEKTIRI